MTKGNLRIHCGPHFVFRAFWMSVGTASCAPPSSSCASRPTRYGAAWTRPLRAADGWLGLCAIADCPKQRPMRGTALIVFFIVSVIPALIASTLSSSIALIVCMWVLPLPAIVMLFREVRG